MLRDVAHKVSDGLLGLSGSTGEGTHVKIGVSPITAEKPVLIRGSMTADKIREQLGLSPLADAVMDSVQFGADWIYCVPVSGTTPGTVGEATHTGTGEGTVTPSGAPTNAFQMIVKITGAGGLNTGVFTLSIDGGYSYGEETTIPMSGEYQVEGTGVVLTFAGSEDAFQVGDEYRIATTAPAMTGGDIAAAFKKLYHFTTEYEYIHVVGESTLAAWQAVSAAQKELEAIYKKPVAVIMEAAYPDEETTMHDYAEEMAADCRKVGNYNLQVVTAWGILVRLDGTTQEVNLAGVAAGLYAKASVQESIGKTRQSAGFQISAATLTELRPAGIEEITEELDLAGFLTFRQYDGLDGYYVYHTNMMGPSGTDYRYMEDVRVLNKIIRETRKEALPLLQEDIDMEDVQGELETRAKFIYTPLQKMIDDSEISGAEIIVPEDQAEEFIETETMAVRIRYVSRGYIREITVDLGRSTAANS